VNSWSYCLINFPWCRSPGPPIPPSSGRPLFSCPRLLAARSPSLRSPFLLRALPSLHLSPLVVYSRTAVVTASLNQDFSGFLQWQRTPQAPPCSLFFLHVLWCVFHASLLALRWNLWPKFSRSHRGQSSPFSTVPIFSPFPLLSFQFKPPSIF